MKVGRRSSPPPPGQEREVRGGDTTRGRTEPLSGRGSRAGAGERLLYATVAEQLRTQGTKQSRLVIVLRYFFGADRIGSDIDL